MRNLSLLVIMVMCFSLYAFAQSSPVATPAASGAASVVPAATVATVVVTPSAPAAPVSAGLVGILIAVVLGLNAILSSLQKVFSAMAKSEPGWLQSVSSILLEVSKFLGSNPDTPPKV